MKKITIIVLIILVILIQKIFPSTQYLKIIKANAKIQDKPSFFATTIYLAPLKSIFETTNFQHGFYQIRLTKNYFAWVHMDNIISYSPATSPIPTSKSLLSPTPLIVNNQIIQLPKNNYYHNIAIDGAIDGKFSGKNYWPKTTSYNILEDPFYQKIPLTILPGELKPNLRYNLQLQGTLEKDLEINWQLEQEPDFPGKYNIQIQKNQNKLTIGDNQTTIKNNQFIDIDKAINGINVKTKNRDWNLELAYGREKSEIKQYQGYGTGSNKIKLPNAPLLENSVKVWINNLPLQEKKDYTIDYFQGKIKFNQNVSQTDFINIIYEFTNPIEDFVPLLSRKNLFALQYQAISQNKQTEQFIKIKTFETYPASTSFFLQYTPLCLESESILLNKNSLIKNIDYVIKPKTGEIVLQNQKLNPQDTVTVEYEYYDSEIVTENIIANDSKGPFNLAKKHIILNSATLFVDDQSLTENLDYYLDYKYGKLYLLHPIAFPKTMVLHYKSLKTRILIEEKKESPFDLNLTYLSEHNLQRDILIEISDETPTTSGNNLIITQYNPISSETELLLEIDGQEIPSPNYSVNYYKGEITVLSQTITENDLKINYTYQNSFLTEATFQGIDGQENAAYYSGVDFELPNTPVKYQGVSYIYLSGNQNLFRDKISGEKRITEGNDYLVEYNSDGSGFKIRFLKYGIDNLDSILKNYPASHTQIKIKYLYSPNPLTYEGLIMQKMYGLNLKTRISKQWEIDTDFAAASHNFSKQHAQKTETFNGSGLYAETYLLAETGLVENSELVFINNFIQTKNLDYYINYENGTIKFLNLTPSSSDTIKISYEYIDSNTLTSGPSNTAYAYQISSNFTDKNLMVNADYKNIDKEFIPIGALNDVKGSKIYGANLNYQLSSQENIFLDYHNTQTFQGSNYQSDPVYEYNDQILTETNLNFWDNIFKTNHQLNYFNTVQESLTTANINDLDQLSLQYLGQVSFGPSYLVTTLGGKKSFTVEDYLDNLNRIHTFTEEYSISTKYEPLKNNFLHKLMFIPYYNLYKLWTIPEISRQISTTKGYKTTIMPTTYLKGIFEYDEQYNDQTYINTRSFLAYNPSSFFHTEYEYTRTETESPLFNQTAQKTYKTKYHLKKIGFYGLANYLGLSAYQAFYQPLKNSYFSYLKNNNYEIKNNNQTNYQSNLQKYAYSNLEPLPGWLLKNVSYQKDLASHKTLVNSETASHNVGSSQIYQWTGDALIIPTTPLLDLFEYQINLYHKKDYKNSQQESAATRNITNQEFPVFQRTQKLSLKPQTINLDSHNFGSFYTTWQENWNEEKNHTSRLDTSLLGLASVQTTEFNNFILKSYEYEIGYTPYKILNLSLNLFDAYQYYNRSENNMTPGSLDKNIDNQKLSVAYTPENWHLDGTYQYKNLNQYYTAIPNITHSLILNNYDTKLTKRADTRSLYFTIYPEKKLSLKLGPQYTDLNETTTNSTALTSHHFYQQIISLEPIIKPIKHLTLSYNVLFKTTFQDQIHQGTGYGGIFNLGYKIIKTKNFQINISYIREDSLGKDFNYLAQESSLNETQKTIATEAVYRNDTIETGIIEININIPVNKSAYINSLNFNVEAYYKKIQDKTNQTDSFDILGLSFGGSILF
ncbi:hypothetical protein HN362_05970 [bacterium]|nr:hypothetical protein [bacterium]